MSLKSIRESYSKLLNVFNDTGIKLNESQKNDLDSFILALESTMSEQRKDAILKAKKATAAKYEKEYSELFESIMDNVAKNSELESKIKVAKARIDESKKITDKVSDYLDLYVESVLPKKTIVDYERMHRLEAIHESLKNSLLINEDDVAETKQNLEESFKKQKSKLETEVAKIQVKLNESLDQQKKMQKKIGHYKAMELLESKTADLPAFEANKVKKLLSESNVKQIEENFDNVLSKVKRQSKDMFKVSQKTLNEEIREIVGSDNNVEENDLLKREGSNKFHNGHMDEDEEYDENDLLNREGSNKKHNGHIDEDDEYDENDLLDREGSNKKHNGHLDDDEEYDENDLLNREGSNKKHNGHLDDDEMFETLEQVNVDEDGDVVLSEEDVIDESTMNYYCNLARE